MNKTLAKLKGCKRKLNKVHTRLFANSMEMDDGYEKWAERRFEAVACHIEEQVITLNKQLGADAKSDAMDWLR